MPLAAPADRIALLQVLDSIRPEVHRQHIVEAVERANLTSDEAALRAKFVRSIGQRLGALRC